MLIVITLVGLALALQVLDVLAHRKDLSSIPPPSAGEDVVRHYRRHFSHLSRGPASNVFGVLVYLRIYLWMAAAVVVFHATSNLVICALCMLFVTGRMRSLQEVGHHAAHGSLCSNRQFGEVLTNVLYQFPAFMPEIRDRHRVHVVEHHHSVNHDHDPDLIELVDKGFVPGLSPMGFWRGFLFPLTLRGLSSRLRECRTYLLADRGTSNFWFRIASVSAVLAVFASTGLYQEMLFLYVVPTLCLYPLFYWIAHVSLHRWFTACPDDLPYHERELAVGRPTDFPGVSGLLIKHNLFPFGDSYHLAHSLYPAVRWSYLPHVDRLLKQHSPSYVAHRSEGLIFPKAGVPSAISELYERMVGRPLSVWRSTRTQVLSQRLSA